MWWNVSPFPPSKVTGGQRIDLLGVEKQQLPAVWAELNAAGMVSGHAYAKGLRTVKTCVGSDWCRFGTQDSTGLGIKLEKFLWGSWTPAKVKLAVSGCPRNCAEATCKDIGVICVDSGYEIHIGGAAGLHIKGTEIMAKVRTETEAMELIAAVMQLYREEGFYLERIYKWMARVGLPSIIARTVDDSCRSCTALLERFIESQRHSQDDPWAERAAGHDAAEFQGLAALRKDRRRMSALAVDATGSMSARWRIFPCEAPGASRAARQPIAVFRTGDDQVHALEDKCPHKQGPLSMGIVHDASVTCPLHAMRISLVTGELMGADAGKGCARVIKVRSVAGRVQLSARGASVTQAVRTTCPYCGVGCGLKATAGEARTLSISPDADHPANQGRICSKGAALGETIGLQDRLLQPDDRQTRRLVGSRHRSRRPFAQRAPSTVMAPTASPSTSPASC